MIVWACLGYAALYLLLAGRTSVEELAATVMVTLVIGRFARHLAHLASHRLALRLPWWRLLRGTATSLARETARVAAVLLPWRSVGESGVVPQPFTAGGDAPADVARRGVVQLALSMAPNGVVLAQLDGSGSLPVHRLDVRQPVSLNRCWPL